MNKELQKFLSDSNLPENHKLTLKFLIESIQKKEKNEFVSKTFLFHGDPGIGKTYFVEHIIKQLELPIYFIGPFNFEHNKAIQCKSLKELYEKLITTKEAVVFIDDLQNTLKMQYDRGDIKVRDSERKHFLSMLEYVKRSEEMKFVFITINDEDVLEESWLDRIETRIELDVPKDKSKRIFLINKYSNYLNKSLINDIAQKSIGYNFRNLDELIKIAYREGRGIISRGIKSAFSVYSPTSMSRYDVIHKTDLKFNNIIGNEKLKKELSFLKLYIKHPKLFHKNGIERSNIMIFSGPPGTGKTYMAKALAGELDIPMINIDASDLLGGAGPIFRISSIANLARRFRNCIIFLDEIDKIIGQEMLSEDREVIGSFEAEIDGMKERTKAIIIMTMNNKARFGSAFHDRVPCFDFNYPSELERKVFIENKVKISKLNFSEINIDSIVRETENKSYRQIERIWNNILFRLMEDKNTVIRSNRIIAENEVLNESIKSVLGFISNGKTLSDMFG